MRCKIIVLFVCLLAQASAFASGDPATLLEKGNKLYAAGKYKDALMSYQEILKDGYQSPELYFNAGNAFYKNGDIAPAILYYERALKLSPGDEDIRFNLRLATVKTTDKVEQVPEFFLSAWWKSVILGFSADTYSIFGVVLMLSASLIFILYLFTGSVAVKKTSFYACLVLVVFGATAIFIAGRQVKYFESHRQAIVFTSSVTVKAGPADRSKSLFVLHNATKVDILERNSGWLKVRVTNGSEGWLRANDVTEI